MTPIGDRQHVAPRVDFGANDYLLKDAPIADLVAAITRVFRNERLPETSLMQPIKRVYGPRSKHSVLTTREEQILRHVCFGASNEEIGERLSISVLTVRQLLARIFRKLDVGDRTLAAVWAVKNGLV